jgi:hypothetical protein
MTGKIATVGCLMLTVTGFVVADDSDNPPSLKTKARLTISDNGRALSIRDGDQLLTTYVYKHDKILRPFFAHVKTRGGIQVTRNFPPVAGKDQVDHATMHPGIWMAFGDISGEDFWRNKGRVVHERFTDKPTGGQGLASFSQRKSYQSSGSRVVCHEDFRCTLRVLPDGYLIEWDSTFSPADDQEFYFGDQEEMGLGIRVATAITELKTGRITDSESRSGAEAVWSQSSAWCDYSGRVDGQPVGITIFCHPNNFRNSWMHARNYGLIAANPFGRKAMNKGPASRIVVKPGESLRLRFGIFMHRKTPDLNQIHKTYVNLAGAN